MEPEENVMNGPAIRRARLHVSYHGAYFHGFAINNDVVTVESELVNALNVITQTSIGISTAGRTDAGVHARAQVVSCDLPSDTNLNTLIRSVNSMCAPHIAVTNAQWVDEHFDARRSATWRRYKYTVWNDAQPNPMLLDRAWHVWRPLSVQLMNLASDAIIGEHNFAAFCRKPDTPEGEPEASMNRYVFNATWRDEGEGMVVFEIRANAFCHQMVRSLVGFLVDVGLGKRPASDTRAVMLAGNRNHGSPVAPPQGLVLWDVGYDGERVHP